jgi:hypothetical protein
VNENARKWCEWLEHEVLVADNDVLIPRGVVMDMYHAKEELRRLDAAARRIEDINRAGNLLTIKQLDEAHKKIGQLNTELKEARDEMFKDAGMYCSTSASPPSPALSNAELSEAIAQTFDLMMRCAPNGPDMTRTRAHYERLLAERERRAIAAPPHVRIASNVFGAVRDGMAVTDGGTVTTERNDASPRMDWSVPCVGNPCVEDK